MSSEKIANSRPLGPSHRGPSLAGHICLVLVTTALLGCPKSGTPRRQVGNAPVPAAEPGPATAGGPVVELTETPATGHFPGKGPTKRPSAPWRVVLDGPIVHPLATDGEAVFAVADGQVYCAEQDGSIRWRARVQADGPPAALAAGIAVSTLDDRVLVLDPQQGLKVSEHPSGGPLVGAPVALGDDLVWVTEAGQVVSAAGWAVTGSDSAVGGGTVSGDHLVFGTRTGELVAVTREGVAWRMVMPGPAAARPAIHDGVVYGVYEGLGGRPGGVAAVSLADGSPRWRTPLDRDPAASPSVAHVLLVPDRTGELAGLDLVSGDRIWRAPVEGDLITRPALGRYAAYVGNADGRLHRFDPDDGGETWSVQLGATVSSDPVILGDLLMVGLADGSLLTLASE
jgi:outer membrane protein assembly factor BamB